jgi:hypothetical protein
MSEEMLREVQQIAVVADRLVWGLVALAVALAIATILVTPRRGTAVFRLGVAVVAGFALAWLGLGWLEGRIVRLATGPENQEAILVVVSRVLSGARIPHPVTWGRSNGLTIHASSAPHRSEAEYVATDPNPPPISSTSPSRATSVPSWS